MTFLINVLLSARDDILVGIDGSNIASSSHSLARGCWVTSFLSASLSLSSSLRDAMPLMLYIKDRARSGPRYSIALL